jgi:hypothetical protein
MSSPRNSWAAAPERCHNAPVVGYEPVSGHALSASSRERRTELATLLAERYAPERAHGTTDDDAVRRALRAAARLRR